MPPPDSTDVEAAVMARLAADAELTALMPGGVYYARAPQGTTKVVIVSLVEHHDVAEFGRRALEETIVQVKAVAPGSTAADVEAAAVRIDALLENVVLTVADYACSPLHRVLRIREPEPDAINPNLTWHHYGGHYRVHAAPLTT